VYKPDFTQLKPIEGAESGGVGGFFKGMGKASRTAGPLTAGPVS
jgi:hypothetical protein